MTEELKTLVRYWFGRARESMEEAPILFDTGHTNASVNRLYYAAFYAMSGALLARGMSSPKHSGTRGLFHRHLVRPGLVPVDLGKLVDKLFDRRQKGDYADLVQFDPAEVETWFPPTGRLIELLESLSSEVSRAGPKGGSSGPCTN